ncbi:MAG: hypothetical protein DWI57_14060 [Chloroflexi bacterium]|nr:MAG: hypothetical protein DWI57_14060 [Chloroflexota bacterium]
MPTSEERMRVLRMIEEGKISAEEGARLLKAIEKSSKKPGRRPPPAPSSNPGENGGRWMRLRVSDTNSGRTKVNMTLPLGLVSMGLQVGARFVPEVNNLDVTQIRDALRSGVPGKILEVMDEDGELVEIFVE